MPAFLISGLSGSGKSTVGRILQQRGYRVIETDFENCLSGWFNNESGLRVVDVPSHPYPKEWLAKHSWLWDKDKMSELIAPIGSELAFFCGGSSNEKAFYSLFAVRFNILVDSNTLKNRLQQREPLRWAEGSAELARIMQWNDEYEERTRLNGAVQIDGSKTPDELADLILEIVEGAAE